MLCCAVLCCALLCSVVLCCALLCSARCNLGHHTKRGRLEGCNSSGHVAGGKRQPGNQVVRLSGIGQVVVLLVGVVEGG